ncbi:MAG TPA: hypothetical protein VN622_09710 [Clostridia bacterium]|nr:hypothetical protein [Clostridia bacterium]
MDINQRDHDIHGEDHLQNRDVAYERRDLGARGIILFFVFLFITGLVIHFAVWGMYRIFTNEAAKQDPVLHPLVSPEKLPQAAILQNTPATNFDKFPQPRLQVDDTTDMDKFHWQENQILNAQPWQDQQGSVHIPISHAMELMSERGLPSRNVPAPMTLMETQGVASSQPPMDQTESGNIALSDSRRQSDASSAPGAPQGDTKNVSGRERERPIPGVNPNEPKNPSRGAGESQKAGSPR